LILQANRKAKFKKYRLKNNYIKFRDGLYVIAPDAIGLRDEDNKIQAGEIIFFERNPTPIFHTIEKDKDGKEILDKSEIYLNEFVIENALKQASQGPRFSISGLGEIFDIFKDPKTLILLLFVGAIAWALISGGLPI
jgi:hypothetical protein